MRITPFYNHYNHLSDREIEEAIARSILTDRERRLLPLLFAKPDEIGTDTWQKTVHMLTDGLNPDKEHIGFLLMLSILGVQSGWNSFPQELIPRLMGIYRYCQAKNLIGMHWLLERVKKLQAAGIPVMFIKGLAMRYYYAPGIPRLMSDYDIAVPRNRFAEAMSLLRDSSVTFKGHANWSDTIIGTVCEKPVQLDVHQWIFKEMGDQTSDIWERAIPVTIQDTEVLVPCPADMFVHQLDTHAGNYFRREMPENRMKWLFDCRHIQLGPAGRQNNTSSSLDPEEIRERAASFHSTYAVRFMLLLYARCFRDRDLFLLAKKIQPMNRNYVLWLRANLEWRQFLGTYNRHGYEPYGPLTLTRCRLSLQRSFFEYRLYRRSQYGGKQKKTWFTWLLSARGIDSCGALWDKYLVRIADMVKRYAGLRETV